MAKVLDSKIPAGPVPEKWKEYKAHQRLVNPKNKLKLDVIVVGTGLAGASSTCAFRTLPVVLTLSLPRVVSMPPSAIRTMVTLSIVCSMIL